MMAIAFGIERGDTTDGAAMDQNMKLTVIHDVLVLETMVACEAV